MAKLHIFVAVALILCATIGIIGFEMKQPAVTALYFRCGMAGFSSGCYRGGFSGRAACYPELHRDGRGFT